MKAIAEYTAKDLAARAAKLDIAGRSGMKKAELYAAIAERMDNCHATALEIDAERSKPVKATPVQGVVSFDFDASNPRPMGRLARARAYHAQRGLVGSRIDFSKFTPAQMRRFNQKSNKLTARTERAKAAALAN